MTAFDSNPLYALVLIAVAYAYFAFCLQRIGRKLADDRAVWAWIPVVQVFFMIRLSQLSYWWILGLLIPVVNIGVGIYVWSRISNRLQKPGWYGVLMVIPVVNLFALGYLALAK